jgi:hypothetical protein
VLFTSHEYVVKVTTFFQHVSSIELNAYKDEWHVAIEVLQEGKRKESNKKGRKKRSDLICRQYFNCYWLSPWWSHHPHNTFMLMYFILSPSLLSLCHSYHPHAIYSIFYHTPNISHSLQDDPTRACIVEPSCCNVWAFGPKWAWRCYPCYKVVMSYPLWCQHCWPTLTI